MLIRNSLATGVAAFVLTALIQCPSAMAATGDTGKLPAPTQRAVERSEPANVDARIKELHDKLHITGEQEGKWKDVADAMRDAGKETRDKLTARADKVKNATPTAVEELQAYEDMQQAHYDAVKKLISPFETLYNAMSPEQKKNADMVFARPSTRQTAANSGSAKTSNAGR